MRKASLFLLALLTASTLLLADTPNLFIPYGWELNAPPGELLDEDSETILQVTGDGTTCNYWLSRPCYLQGGHTYMISFWGRSPDKADGTFITGPSGCNIDRCNSFNPNWEFCSDIIVFPHNQNSARIRMGQWMLKGTAEYKDISLREVLPVYSRQDDIILGTGESMKGNLYSFSASFNSWGHAEARVLDYLTTYFNTDRLVFGKDQEVVYRFNVGNRTLLSADLETNIHYYSGGALVVEVSNDRQNWTTLGTKQEAGELHFTLPTELFPAKEIFVRLHAISEVVTDADNAAPGSLQVKILNFNAKVDGTPVEMNGTTQYAEILDSDENNVVVNILDLGAVLPDGDNTVRLKVTNISQNELNLEPTAALTHQDQTIEGDSHDKYTLQPGETKEIQVPYVIKDTGSCNLLLSLNGDSSFQFTCKIFVSDYYNNTYGELLASDDQAAIWGTSPEWKLHPTRRLPATRGSSLEIATAKGETETTQLVVTPSVELTGVNFKVSELKNAEGDAIPADKIDLLRVHYLDIQVKTDATGILGYWPDPLPPVKPNMTLHAKTNQPFFVRANIPTDTKAGVYQGTITISAENGWTASVPLSVRVFDFVLPDTMTCETAFGFTIQEAEKYQKAETEEEKAKLLDSYLEFLSQHHISPYNPAPKIGLTPRIIGKTEGKPLDEWEISIDWTAWDEQIAKAFDQYHFNTLNLSVQGMGYGTFYSRVEPTFLGYAENTPEYKTLHPKYLKLLQDHLEEKGWLDKAYVYWFDEPAPEDYDFVMNGFRKLREGAPKIRRMLTESIEKPLLGGPNLWCTPTHCLNDKDWAERRPLGENLWWYLCTGPKAPYITIFIDHPGIEMRAWLWQSWQHHVQGVLVWATNYWTSPAAYPDGLQNPYVDPMSWVSGYGTKPGTKNPWGNGDGRFYYPPEDAQDGTQPNCILDPPVTSIRLEMLRDGLEDYEYFVMLQKLLEEKKETLSKVKYEEYAKLLEVPAEVTSSMTEFSADPTPLKTHRIKLAEAIEKLQ